MTWISPSSINSFEYCEVQFYLIKRMGYPPKKSSYIYNGIRAHAILEETTPTSPLPLPDNLPLAFSGKIPKIVKREYKIKSERFQIYGKIDELWVEKGIIRLIEDKPGNRVSDSHKLQVLIYAIVFKDIFGEYPIEVIVRDRDSGKIKWREMVNERNEEWARTELERMRRVLNGEEKPKPTSSINRCFKCSVNYVCEIFRSRLEQEAVNRTMRNNA